MVGGFHQTRPRQSAAEKYGTASAGPMRQYDTHLEKTRKCLPAVVRLQAGRSSRASLQANPQTPGSPPPCVDGVAAWRDVGVVGADGRWVRDDMVIRGDADDAPKDDCRAGSIVLWRVACMDLLCLGEPAPGSTALKALGHDVQDP